MENLDLKLEKKINDKTSIIKLILLLFCDLIMYSTILNKYNIYINSQNDYININYLGGEVLIFIWTTLMWWFFTIKLCNSIYIEFIRIIENCIYIMIITILIILSNMHLSQYKLLFVIIIIISAIELGMKYGLFISVISSLIVLGIDLIYLPNIGVNRYFQDDLILTGIFIFGFLYFRLLCKNGESK